MEITLEYVTKKAEEWAARADVYRGLTYKSLRVDSTYRREMIVLCQENVAWYMKRAAQIAAQQAVQP